MRQTTAARNPLLNTPVQLLDTLMCPTAPTPHSSPAAPVTLPPARLPCQVVNLHYMLSKTVVKARPSVLWCYKKELYLSSHKKKRMQQIKKMAQVRCGGAGGCSGVIVCGAGEVLQCVSMAEGSGPGAACPDSLCSAC